MLGVHKLIVIEKGITPENLYKIYADPYITNAISYGDKKPYPVFHELAHYASLIIDGVFSGAFLIVHYSEFETEIHSLLFKECRKLCHEICHKLIDYCFTESPAIRITATVGGELNSVKNILLKCGFTYEGFRRDAYLKNGKLEGIHILGITRNEWSEKQ